MSEKLKPCPFCGGRAELKHYIIKGYEPDRMYYVECSKCGQTVVKGKFDTTYHSDKWAINKAIKAWNKRPNTWHTGTPTEKGWYLIKYECLVEGRYKGKLTYRAVHIYYDKYGIYNEDGSIGHDEVWKPIEYQIIEQNKETD